jgi:hypothetical protein
MGGSGRPNGDHGDGEHPNERPDVPALSPLPPASTTFIVWQNSAPFVAAATGGYLVNSTW